MSENSALKPLDHGTKVATVVSNSNRVLLPIEPTELSAVFGIDDPDVARRLLGQLVNVLHPDSGKSVDVGVINEALALVRGLNPNDTLEAMTATMLVAAQHAALDAMRRAMHSEQTPAGRQSYMALALKAMRTCAQLVESLNRGRGKGVTQQIIVKHMSVEPGGQAIVGAVAPGRG